MDWHSPQKAVVSATHVFLIKKKRKLQVDDDSGRPRCGLENMKREQDLNTLFKKCMAESGNM